MILRPTLRSGAWERWHPAGLGAKRRYSPSDQQ
jgi:hypothetical protein